MSLTFSILHFLSPLILILFFKKIKKGHDLRNIPVLLLSLFVFLLSNIPILVHVYSDGNFSYNLFSLINGVKIFLGGGFFFGGGGPSFGGVPVVFKQ